MCHLSISSFVSLFLFLYESSIRVIIGVIDILGIVYCMYPWTSRDID